MIEQMKAASSQFECCVTIAEMESSLRPLIFVNEKFSDITGYSVDFAVGKNCNFLQRPLTDKTKIAFMRQSFKDKTSCCVDLINYKKNGDPFWNRLVLLPLEQDEKLFYIGLQNDITQKRSKKNSEVDLRSVQDSEICHKIRNPLSIVLGINSNLRDHNYSEEKKVELQRKLKDAVRRIDDFVIDLEDLSEFENWKYLG
jgi:PAS domain S-box-containing protein